VRTPQCRFDVFLARPHHLLPHVVSPPLLVQEGHGILARKLLPDPRGYLGQVWHGDFGNDLFAWFSVRHGNTSTPEI
jgi:hypothetical protein